MKRNEIQKQLEQDPRNKKYADRGISPLMQVDSQARILIIGQAPGRKTEEAGVLFSDKSGETLLSWMEIDKTTFYSPVIAIMPMDFYYPGKGTSGDLPPRKFIAEEYHKKLLALMPDIELTILIGNYAVKHYLGKSMKRNLTETVYCFREYLPAYFPIVHPSPLNFRWQKKNPWFLEDVVPALQEQVSSILHHD